jgi:hypothetical protein
MNSRNCVPSGRPTGTVQGPPRGPLHHPESVVQISLQRVVPPIRVKGLKVREQRFHRLGVCMSRRIPSKSRSQDHPAATRMGQCCAVPFGGVATVTSAPRMMPNGVYQDRGNQPRRPPTSVVTPSARRRSSAEHRRRRRLSTSGRPESWPFEGRHRTCRRGNASLPAIRPPVREPGVAAAGADRSATMTRLDSAPSASLRCSGTSSGGVI